MMMTVLINTISNSVFERIITELQTNK